MDSIKIEKNRLKIEYTIKHDNVRDNFPDFEQFLRKNNAEIVYSLFFTKRIESIKFNNTHYDAEELGYTLFEIIFNFANKSTRYLRKAY